MANKNLFSRFDSVGEESQLTPPSTPPKSKNLTGDFSVPCALPLVEGLHTDLRNIAPETLAELINGYYDSVITSYKIIDCRYPYEFDGGHINGAINLYSEKLVNNFFTESCGQEKDQPNGRSILIFHCEFSQQRGPTLLKYLRQLDRAKNCENYPQLDFPEIYILDGGYSKFFKRFECLCTGGYIEMNDPRYEDEFDQFWVNKKYSKRKMEKTKGREFGRKLSRTLNF